MDQKEAVIETADAYESVSTAIISAIVEAKNTEYEQVEPVLNAIDLDALNQLLSHDGGKQKIEIPITLEMSDIKVIIYQDKRIIAIPAC